ncbi:MAG: hypothetical protein M1834_009610 [Cirrosporium novae-zelandiae]|nr:MAG: hypothetical protein M1834_009610 [Cirrosporium novae-zelandiae]
MFLLWTPESSATLGQYAEGRDIHVPKDQNSYKGVTNSLTSVPMVQWLPFNDTTVMIASDIMIDRRSQVISAITVANSGLDEYIGDTFLTSTRMLLSKRIAHIYVMWNEEYLAFFITMDEITPSANSSYLLIIRRSSHYRNSKVMIQDTEPREINTTISACSLNMQELQTKRFHLGGVSRLHASPILSTNSPKAKNIMIPRPLGMPEKTGSSILRPPQPQCLPFHAAPRISKFTPLTVQKHVQSHSEPPRNRCTRNSLQGLRYTPRESCPDPRVKALASAERFVDAKRGKSVERKVMHVRSGSPLRYISSRRRRLHKHGKTILEEQGSLLSQDQVALTREKLSIATRYKRRRPSIVQTSTTENTSNPPPSEVLTTFDGTYEDLNCDVLPLLHPKKCKSGLVRDENKIRKETRIEEHTVRQECFSRFRNPLRNRFTAKSSLAPTAAQATVAEGYVTKDIDLQGSRALKNIMAQRTRRNELDKHLESFISASPLKRMGRSVKNIIGKLKFGQHFSNGQ